MPGSRPQANLKRILIAVLMTATIVSAGCLDAAEDEPKVPTLAGGATGAPSKPPSQPQSGGAPAAGQGNTSTNQTNDPGNATNGNNTTAPPANNTTSPPNNNTTQAPDTGIRPEFARPSDATIRPGSQISSAVGQCTTNFIFTSKTNNSVYVGTAAHCVAAIGEEIEIRTPSNTGVAGTGTVVYSAWLDMGFEPDLSNTLDPWGSQHHPNDFALIQIPYDLIDDTSPSVIGFGGPLAVEAHAKMGFGDRILVYGNSWVRQGIDPIQTMEGVVTSAGEWSFYGQSIAPTIPGDSGGPVLTRSGNAAGLVSAITLLDSTLAKFPGEVQFASLERALKAAAAKGFELDLATEAPISDGILP